MVTNILLSITLPGTCPLISLVWAVIITGGMAVAQSAVLAGGVGDIVMLMLVMGLVSFLTSAMVKDLHTSLLNGCTGALIPKNCTQNS